MIKLLLTCREVVDHRVVTCSGVLGDRDSSRSQF